MYEKFIKWIDRFPLKNESICLGAGFVFGLIVYGVADLIF